MKQRVMNCRKFLFIGRISVLTLCLTLALMPLSALAAQTSSALPLGTLRITYGFPVPEIETANDLQPTQEDLSLIQEIQANSDEEWLADEYVAVSMGDLPLQSEPGEPILPSKPAMILLPYGTTVRDIVVDGGNQVSLDGSYLVQPGQEPYALSEWAPSEPTSPDPNVYDSPDHFPGTLYSDVMIQNKNGYQILIVTLHPVQYMAQMGTVSYYDRVTLEVTIEEAESGCFSGSYEDKSLVQSLVDDPQMADTYPTDPEAPNDFSSLLDSGDYEYVIITNETLEATSGPNNFQTLRDDKIARGITATIVTTEWIYANYSGTRPDGSSDDQTAIRNFIIDAYTTWNTKYVLLGGDGDGADNGDVIIPRKGFMVQGSYSDTCIPADMYYGCLDGTFDYDADGYYGEPTDGPNGGMPDLFAEVYIGRACVDSGTEVQNFVHKTLAYQNVSWSDDNLRNVRMVGEYLGFGGPAQYANNAMNEIKEGSSAHGYTTVGFKNSEYADQFDVSTLYDADGTWSGSQLVNIINDNAHIINHLGHANVTYVMKMYNSTVDGFTNDELYFIGYSQGCYSGSFDNRGTGSTSYGSSDCISEHLTAGAHGAVAFISNSRYGWGRYNSTDGASQHYDREFWDAVLGEDILNIGIANHDSKEDNAWRASSWVDRWCIYQLTLFGDPELSIKTGNLDAPEISITSPNGGDALFGGNIHNITWMATDDDFGDTPITIEYNEGSSWKTIATGEANDGIYAWTVPGIDAAAATIRISATDLSGNIGMAYSNDTFVIDSSVPTVSLTSPIGGETMTGGDTHTITWTPATDTNLINNPISLAYYDGFSWATIATGEANDGSYSWLVPGFNISTARVRVLVVDAAGRIGIDESADDFTIDSAPAVTVTGPNGGECYLGGSDCNIEWTVSDMNLAANPITIEYYDGSVWTTIVANYANSGTYNWTVPSEGTLNGRIRVSAIDTSDNTSSDQSDGAFSIDSGPPIVAVTSPNGGECWAGGSSHTITWNAADVNFGATPISIEYYDGSSWVTIATNEANDGTFAWTVPELNIANAKIRVVAVDSADNAGNDESDNVFSIDSTDPTVGVTGPNGGELWTGGNSYNITWTSSDNNPGTSSVVIEYYDGSSWITIAENLPVDETGDGSYSWTVPSLNVYSAKIRVTVGDTAGNASSDESDANFTIDSDPTVVLTGPNGGQYWAGGSIHEITWEADDINLGANPITLEYYDGSSWVVIATGEADDGIYAWAVPTINTSSAMVRVVATDTGGNSATDPSDGCFDIDSTSPTVTLLNHNGGSCVQGGTYTVIVWSASDNGLTANPITLEYYDGSSWTTIASNLSNTGSYGWIYPAIDTSEARVRVSAIDSAGNSSTDQSDSAFTIDSSAPDVSIVSPNGGELLVGGSVYEITWTASDENLPADPVRLYYYYYGSEITIATGEANDGSYMWTVPSVNGTSVRISICVTDIAGETGYDYSDDYFVIDSAAPAVDLLVPNGGQVYAGGSTQAITWTASDINLTDNPISINYYNGSTWTSIATDEPNDGAYAWTVPAVNIENAKIRVSAIDTLGNIGSDESDSYFTIDSAPELSLDIPSGGEHWVGGSLHEITWTATDINLGENPISLAYFNGAIWITIAQDEPNDGSYTWRVPHLDINNAKIKVKATDESGNVAQEESDAFIIDSTAAGITVLSPNGGECWGGGSSHNITWEALDSNLGDLPIDLEYYNGSSWVTIANGEADDGSYTWTVPNINTAAAKVRITATDMAGNISSGESNDVFIIDNTYPKVTVLSPDSGEYMAGESSYTITWIATDSHLGATPITIEYYNGANWMTIATGETNDGNYIWTTPNLDVSTAKIRLSVIDLGGNTESDESDGNFAIDSTSPAVTLASPDGGENWIGGTPHTIIWRVSDTNLSNNTVVVEYYNGSAWVLISADADNSGRYDWMVPDINTSKAKVRVTITDRVGNVGSDESNADFTIDSTPELTIDSPNGGEYLQGGIISTISWTTSNIESGEYPIVIEYYDGSSWLPIAIGEHDNGSYHWTVPNINTSRAKVRVSCIDVSGNVLEDESDVAFTIDTLSPSVTVHTPNGGECLASGDSQEIIWTATDANLGGSCITISYYEGSSWTIVTTGETNDGSYIWMVPNIDLSVARIMVSVTDKAGNTVSDRSDGNFAVDGSPIAAPESNMEDNEEVIDDGLVVLNWGDDSETTEILFMVGKSKGKTKDKGKRHGLILNWAGVSHDSAVRYAIEIDNDDDFSSPLISESGLSESECALDSIEEDGTYYWRMKVIDDTGNESNWCAAEVFDVDADSTGQPPFGLIGVAAAGMVILMGPAYAIRSRKRREVDSAGDLELCDEEGLYTDSTDFIYDGFATVPATKLRALKSGDVTIDRLIDEAIVFLQQSIVARMGTDEANLTAADIERISKSDGIAAEYMIEGIRKFHCHIPILEAIIVQKQADGMDADAEKAKLIAEQAIVPVFEELVDNLVLSHQHLAFTSLDEAKEYQGTGWIVDQEIKRTNIAFAKGNQLNKHNPRLAVEYFSQSCKHATFAKAEAQLYKGIER